MPDHDELAGLLERRLELRLAQILNRGNAFDPGQPADFDAAIAWNVGRVAGALERLEKLFQEAAKRDGA